MLQDELPYRVELSWRRGDRQGRYLPGLLRQDCDPGGPGQRVGLWAVEQALAACTNVPAGRASGRLAVPPLRRYLQGRLPEYMVPSAFVALERAAADAQRQGRPPGPACPGPRAGRRPRHTCRRGRDRGGLAAIWAEVLGVERVGRQTTSSSSAATRCWPRR